MHYLLIPYLILGCIAIIGFHAHRKPGVKASLVLAAGGILLMLFVAIVLRPVTGDSWRYYQYFIKVRDLPFLEIFGYNDPDPLYALLNWVVGQAGSPSWLLYAATLVVYFCAIYLALHKRFTPVQLSILIVSLAAYPYFISYAANGLRQGLGMAFLLVGYVWIREGRKSAWIWILTATLWHSGVWLAVSVFVIHQFMCVLVKNEVVRWGCVFGVWLLSVVLSVTGLNAAIGGLLPKLVELESSYDIYFMDSSEFGYRSGFRLDFTLFSMVPLLIAIMLRRQGRTFDYKTAAGWFLSLYFSLNIIYHLFAFAPFADRFAAFSWWLMPIVVLLQVRASEKQRLMSLFVLSSVLMNALMMQFYTGNYLKPPIWL